MLGEQIVNWLLYFYIYSIFGWCFESTYVSLKQKKFVNRGFMRGPFLPLYGSGAVLMLFVSSPFSHIIPLVFLSGMIGATLLEYVTGVTMEALFKVRYWDYSSKKFQFQGHICLGSSLAWGVLTLLLTYLFQPFLLLMISKVTLTVVYLFLIVVTVLGAVDFIWAFKEAINLRNILVRMSKAKEELSRLQKRLDVIIAIVDDAAGELKEEIGERVMSGKPVELITGVGERLESLKVKLPKVGHNKYGDRFKEELAEIRDRYQFHKDNPSGRKIMKSYYQRLVFRGNPMLNSGKYAEALDEIKKGFEKRVEDLKKNVKNQKKDSE